VSKVLPDPLDHKDLLDLRDHKEQHLLYLDLRDHREKLGLQGLLGLPDLLDLLG
jgi:hypothetical protein